MQYRFASFLLDLDRHELRSDDGQVIELSPRPFELLRHLVEQAPRAVPRDELLERVWTDVHTLEGVLNQAVSQLRRALSDFEGGEAVIETVRGHGYRLGAPVHGGVARRGPLPDPAPAQKPSLVVLPFENLSPDPAQEYLGDAFTEDMTTELARDPYVLVISRTSAFTYKGRCVRVQDVGRELGVRYVLEGSVRAADGRVRITTQLIDAATGGHLWSERYDRELREVLALHTEIAEQVFARVGREIRRAEARRLTHRPMLSLSAWEAHLKGVHHLNRNSFTDNEAARALFTRVLELEPDFAPAYANLAITFVSEYMNGWNRDPTLLDRADVLANRAIALDPEQPQGYQTVAWVEFLRGNPREALAAIDRAIALVPNLEAHHALRGMILARLARLEEAAAALGRSLRLNPRAPNLTVLLSAAYVGFATGHREDALGYLELARSVAPEDLAVRVGLAGLHLLEGAHGRAVSEVREIARLRPDLTAEAALALIPGLEQLLHAEERSRSQLAEDLRKAGLR